MKLLTVFALICAMIALTTAANEGGKDGSEPNPPEEHLVEKRFGHHWRHWFRPWYTRRHHWHPYRNWGWTRYGNRYFHYFPYQWTWAQAQRYCKSLNANLASVSNLGEYQALQRVIFQNAHDYVPTWIGGSNAQEDNYWFWIGGSHFTYANWCAGEPNNVGGREHCIHMNWTGNRCVNDIPCTNRYPFVCARKIRHSLG